jgi:hypothetical protein
MISVPVRAENGQNSYRQIFLLNRSLRLGSGSSVRNEHYAARLSGFNGA